MGTISTEIPGATVREYKSTTYSCFRCGKSAFTFEYSPGDNALRFMDVKCTNCSLTMSGLREDEPYGKPLAGVYICDPDGTTSMGGDEIIVLITSGDKEAVNKVLAKRGQECYALPHMCDPLDPITSQAVIAELKRVGCTTVRMNESDKARRIASQNKQEIANAEKEKRMAIAELSSAKDRLKQETELVAKNTDAAKAAKKESCDEGDGSRFEEIL